MMVSLDGYFEGPNSQIDWHNVDEEYSEYAAGLLSSVDAILFGRVTYQLMESYWPTSVAASRDPIIANKMNQMAKIVFTKTLDWTDWQNTSIVKGDLIENISNLKQQPGKDLVILGSGMLVAELTRYGLIDEYQLIVNPVVLGSGHSLFKELHDKVQLSLLESKPFQSGNVLLRYKTK